MGGTIMWLDNASDIDLLFYSPYVDTIVKFTETPSLTPLTIGLYGSWGAGKSSLLRLIEKRLEAKSGKVVCISLNAWQFEDYEDAKVAIMESLLKALKENRTIFETAGEKIKSLLKRIDYFKIGKSLLIKGAPYALGAITGNPIPIAVNLSADLAMTTDISSKLQTFGNEYLKSDESGGITENIRKFREEFEDMLKDVKSIDNLVVIVDDLDRCAPERIIDTLEAIKLFLSVTKTTFVIAVDQRIIEYAVKTKYPQIEGFDISPDYIEKIVQLPIKIPELSAKDIENYLLLLICQLQLEQDSFLALIQKIYEKKIMLSDTSISWSQISSLLKDVEGNYKPDFDEATLKTEIECIAEISHVVSASLKGNPRQAKRFLNTFFVRKNLAELYFGDEISLPILAKLLALETIDSRAFKMLYEWNGNYDGEIAPLKAVETAIREGKDLDADYSLWTNPRIVKWLKSNPTNLYQQDLSKYFYLSREALSSVEDIVASFTEEERKMLSGLQHCIAGQEDMQIQQLKEMPASSQLKVCDSVLLHFKSDNIGLNIICRIFEAYKDCQLGIIETLYSKPKTFFRLGTIPHIKRMYNANRQQIESCLKRLGTDAKIDQRYIEEVTGNAVSKAAKRR